MIGKHLLSVLNKLKIPANDLFKKSPYFRLVSAKRMGIKII